MKLTFRPTVAAVAFAVAACSSSPSGAARTAPAPSSGTSDQAYIERAREDSLKHPYVKADVDFMTGMIGHHAQAITMSQMAPSHGASPEVQRLASRIINAQRDEILTMQRWLRDRNKPVPDPKPGEPMHMAMSADEHAMHHGEHAEHEMMPGMLSDEQMQQLDAARGKEFDRLFLQYMIQHHGGAVTMVKTLFDSYGAAQDELTFKIASDVNADQQTEIARMQKMLAEVLFQRSTP